MALTEALSDKTYSRGMKNKLKDYQYQLSLIPVLINNLMEGRGGAHAVRDFLKVAESELDNRWQEHRVRRRAISNSALPRRDHLQASHLFEVEHRYLKALTASLKQLARYPGLNRKVHLERALAEYGTAHRHRERVLELRTSTSPLLMERLQRVA